ncbi:hypothetical protein J7T55_009482 [Diaporthe amygdali]|uniref:uncharacterized protein n=1 Tax=Phomopsis amygdali TaxID=1214568 RepID=UPI0022FEAB66|nr:uncharacterized protein J7T55_009482 [Diaporthe amygdali]KAJ0104318.1 hypothetical protein J7T55_009482 [Diaporthe amygdali]
MKWPGDAPEKAPKIAKSGDTVISYEPTETHKRTDEIYSGWMKASFTPAHWMPVQAIIEGDDEVLETSFSP